MIDALLDAWRLKHVDRAGWIRAGVTHPESVAAHSWGISALLLAFAPDDLDLGKALAYAAVHDLPEAITGDFTPADNVDRQEKQRLEIDAMVRMGDLSPRIHVTWQRYQAQIDPESRFVKQLDRVDMALQAVIYQSDQCDMTEFVASAAAFVTDPALTSLMMQIQARMQD